METNLGSIPTYFVGNHYEVSGAKTTKYYYAGSQRIAMNADGLTFFMLGDHLGSTSITTDANGVLASEMKYTAWGEVRETNGTTLTNYTYTGQYSHVNDFGLLYYNARWYDPSLSRFAQADTIVPGGIQGLDRYAYVNNSPVRYTDPSGHDPSNNNCDYGGVDYCDSDMHSLPAIPWYVPPLDPNTQNDVIYGEAARQDAFLQAVLRHQDELPDGMTVQLFLGMASAECGYDNGWDNFCSITAGGMSADGIMQISIVNDFHHQGCYQNTAAGFDCIVQDAISYLNRIADNIATGKGEKEVEDNFSGLASEDAVKLLMYYNGGEYFPLATYRGETSAEGNQNYLKQVAKYVDNSPFGSEYNAPVLAANLYLAQDYLNTYLIANPVSP